MQIVRSRTLYDVCIVGSGITAAMVAEKLADERNVRVVVVEAGDDMPPVQDWYRLRRRFLDYGESPWPADHLDDASVEGIQSPSPPPCGRHSTT